MDPKILSKNLDLFVASLSLYFSQKKIVFKTLKRKS